MSQVSWRRENYAVLPTGGSQYRGNILTIPSVSKDDRGTYYCVAENGVGKGKRRNIAVEIEFSPVITVPRSVKLCTRNNHSRKLCPDFSFYLGLVWDKPSSTIWTSNAMLWLTHLRQSLGGKTKCNSPIINITGSNNSIANHFFIFVLIISD